MHLQFYCTLGDILLKLQDAVTIFMGVLLGAMPFILFGVLVSAALAHFVKEERLIKLIPRNRLLALVMACLVGFLFPVCECGNIPVARRLIAKGVPANVAITFLLAAPVFNPITIASTWAAFSFMPEILIFRVLFTFIIAVSIGLVFSRAESLNELLVTEKVAHQHKGDCDDCDHYHVHYSENRIWSFIRSVGEEFFEMMSALIFGAMMAALIQTFVPREIILSIGQSGFASILAMIFLAGIISVCSSVDAFIALSYAGTFTNGSILAFLVFGPMIDLKSIWMLKTTFRWKAIVYLVLMTGLMTILLTTFYNFYLN